jgi:hypothetical protein
MSKEVMKLALEALQECRRDPRLKYEHPTYDKAIKALEEALAKQEQPIKEVVVNADYREMWKQQVKMNQQLTAALSAPPAKQQQGEPVARVGPWHDGRLTLIPRYSYQTFEHNQPLYATPQQRKPLNHEQRVAVASAWRDGNGTVSELISLVEAAHGIKE